MNKSILLLCLIFTSFSLKSLAQNEHYDAVIIGHVVSEGQHIPFVNIYLEDSNYGTTTMLPDTT
nr:hypothetical protein [uncultured Draconibacterium sp.]